MSGNTRKSIFTISKAETDKMKVLRKFMKHAKDKKSQRRRHKIKTQTMENEKLNLDRHNYGAWYLDPSKWEERFQNLSDPKSIAIIKTRNISNKRRFSVKEEVAIQEVSYTWYINLFLTETWKLVLHYNMTVQILTKKSLWIVQ